MKEPYTEGLANHCGLESCADSREVIREAVDRGTSRPAIELRNHSFEVPTLYYEGEGNTEGDVISKPFKDLTESETLCMLGNSRPRTGRSQRFSTVARQTERLGKVCGHTPNVHVFEKSDTGIVPKKKPNKAELFQSAAEVLEERAVTNGNSG